MWTRLLLVCALLVLTAGCGSDETTTGGGSGPGP